MVEEEEKLVTGTDSYGARRDMEGYDVITSLGIDDERIRLGEQPQRVRSMFAPSEYAKWYRLHPLQQQNPSLVLSTSTLLQVQVYHTPGQDSSLYSN